MLLRHGCLSPFPPLTELVQVRHEHVPHDDVERQGCEQPVERPLGGGLVEAVESGLELLRVRHRDRRRRRLGNLLGERQPRGLRGRQPVGQVRSHREHPGHVVLAVEPEASGRAAGREQAVPALPRAEVAGEMLLRHRRLSLFPALTELVQVRHEHVPQHDVEREGCEQPVERPLGGGLVEPVESRLELPRVGHRRGGGRLGDLLGEGKPRGLRGRQAVVQVCAHGEHAGDVVLAVEPEASGRAARREQAVPTLPCAQGLHGHADAARELADAEQLVVGRGHRSSRGGGKR